MKLPPFDPTRRGLVAATDAHSWQDARFASELSWIPPAMRGATEACAELETLDAFREAL